MRQCEGYTRHPDESVRDVEARVVPEEVSGYLTRDGSEASGQIISESQAAQWNQEALEVQAQVKAMMEKYRPTLGTGNGDRGTAPVFEQQATEQAVIKHKAGDEKSQAFWRMLVSGDPETALVAKATASFVCRLITAEMIGSRSGGMRLEFTEDPMRLADVLGAIDRATGAAGWQLMQRKAGF